MDQEQLFTTRLEAIGAAMQDKLRLRPAPFSRLVARSRTRLPRRQYRNALALAEAERLAANPKLSRTLDHAALDRAARELATHLKTIDLADERKGRLLSLLGSVSINLISVACLLVAVLLWRGYL